MAWTPGVLSGLLFGSTVVLAALAVIGWRTRGRRVVMFVVFMITVATWTAVYGIQLGFTLLPEQLVWQRYTTAISALVPPVFLAFAYQSTGTKSQLVSWENRLFTAEALVFFALAITNDVHGLVWSNVTVTQFMGSLVLNPQFAIGYAVHIGIAYFVVLLGVWAIISVYFRATTLYRKQSVLLLTGAIPPFIFHILYTIKASPVPGLDFTPFAFVVTGITFGSALFYFDLLERTPIAHQRAIELTGDGILVVDSNGLVVDSNRIVTELYDASTVDEMHISTLTGESDPQNLHGKTIPGVIDGTQRMYTIYVSELTDETIPNAGFSLVYRDVTDQKASEQRLQVTNRILRHNLRNEMNVIIGRADMLSDIATTPKQRDIATTIKANAEGLVSLSDKARNIVTYQNEHQSSHDTVNVASVLEPLITEFNTEYETASIGLSCPADAAVTVLSADSLALALRNIIENAVEHNDPTSLTVEITVTTTSEQTSITVRDNGVGMPVSEQYVLQNQQETQLIHSSGIGLWLTYWIVSSSGGTITVESTPGTGTTVSLVFDNPTGPAHE